MSGEPDDQLQRIYMRTSDRKAAIRKISSLSIMALLLGSAAGLLATFHVQPSYATVPGVNGKIAFTSERGSTTNPISTNREVYSTNSDGTGLQRLTNNPALADELPSWSPDGTKLVFGSNRDNNEVRLFTMNADGSNQQELPNPIAGDDAKWSPDGKKFAYDGFYNVGLSQLKTIYTVNIDGTGRTRLVNIAGSNDGGAVWSPDGSKIAFSSSRDGKFQAYVMNPDGSGQTRLTNDAFNDFPSSWSPDGSKILFTSDRDGNFEIYVMNADGTGQTRLTNNPAIYGSAVWSPDGKKIAFESERDGNREIYVMNADGTGQTRITNNPAPDFAPDWGRQPQQVALTVKSQDMNGNLISGYWTVLYDGNGNVLKTGFTPATFTINAGQQYRIGMGNFGSYSFFNWADNGSSQNPRSITINANTQLTAVYKTSATYPITHMSDTTASSGYGVHAPKPARAEYASATSHLIGDKIDSITLKLKRVGTISGTATIGILDSANNVKKSFGTINVSTLTTTYTDYEFHLSNNELYSVQSGDRIGIKYTGGDANNWVSVMLDLDPADPFDGTHSYHQYFQSGAWLSNTDRDMYMILKQTHA